MVVEQSHKLYRKEKKSEEYVTKQQYPVTPIFTITVQTSHKHVIQRENLTENPLYF